MGKDSDEIIFEDEVTEKPMKGKSESKLRKELKACHKEKQEYLNGWQRSKADLINFKREAQEAGQKLAKFASEDTIVQILPVLDSFEMALVHTDDKGVEQIYKQLLGVLASNGVQQQKAEGEKFDPQKYDSIENIPVSDKKDDHKVLEVVQTGYTMHDKIIRPAKVKIGEFK